MNETTKTTYRAQTARDAQDMGYSKSHCQYLETHAFELHGYFRAKGDWKSADEMFTRTLSESLVGNDGD